MRSIFISLLCLLPFCGRTQSLPIIPAPASVERDLSRTAYVSGEVNVIYNDAVSADVAEMIVTYLRTQKKMKAIACENHRYTPNGSAIVVENLATDSLSEAYTIRIDTAVYLGGNPRGLLHAYQSLVQMMEPQPVLKSRGDKMFALPYCTIKDQPRFAYRGMHLDVGRHFFPVSFIKRYLSLMARYKFNTFHWHLTEDQGWRIEIKKYPRLAAIASQRKETMIAKNFDPYKGDGKAYGGYYTQDAIKEVVAYATRLGITVIPEIEMPGHSLAALAAYPQLGCTGGPYEAATRWGVFDDVYCAGNEQVFTFLQDVLDEVMALFPARYIHVGGDECPKARWKTCAKCQQRIKTEKLKDEHELQSYFIQRIEKYLNSKGRQLIGWDEILEGGLAANATVMSWRGTEGGIAAARQNHDAIMTPGGFCYFDHYQARGNTEPLAIGGFTPVKKVYDYEPVPQELTAEQGKRIIGAQGNVWTEYMKTTSHVEYMVFPRAIALAEAVWSPKDKKDYDDFLNRLKTEMQWLDAQKVNYAKHVFGLQTKVVPAAGGGVEVVMQTRNDKAAIRYTTNGRAPNHRSALYEKPLLVQHPMLLRAGVFENKKMTGSAYEQAFTIHKAVGKKITLAVPPHNNYNPGDPFYLVNGIEGVENYSDNQWHGFSGKNLDATIDLGSEMPVKEIDLNFINNKRAWIHPPVKIECYFSSDGQNFTKVHEGTPADLKQGINKYVMSFNVSARYIRIVAHNTGKIPEGHEGAGYDAWLFVDELLVW
jgi:hexosaminidase